MDLNGHNFSIVCTAIVKHQLDMMIYHREVMPEDDEVV